MPLDIRQHTISVMTPHDSEPRKRRPNLKKKNLRKKEKKEEKRMGNRKRTRPIKQALRMNFCN